jgi:hypothetical protein
MELRDLQKMTVVKLREEALSMGGFVGVSGMSKQQLIEAMAPRLGIDLEAAMKAVREKFATDKPAIKQEIRSLKAQRDDALTTHDATAVAQVRKQIKKHKRTLRRMARQARVATV